MGSRRQQGEVDGIWSPTGGGVGVKKKNGGVGGNLDSMVAECKTQ